MSWFKKAVNSGKKFFKKVSNGTQDFFKKGGYLDKGLDYAGKGLQYGSKIVGAIEKIPILGSALSPLTSIARTGLNLGNQLVGGVRTGQGLVQNVVHSAKTGDYKGAVQGAGNILEKAKQIKQDGGIKYA